MPREPPFGARRPRGKPRISPRSIRLKRHTRIRCGRRRAVIIPRPRMVGRSGRVFAAIRVVPQRFFTAFVSYRDKGRFFIGFQIQFSYTEVTHGVQKDAEYAEIRLSHAGGPAQAGAGDAALLGAAGPLQRAAEEERGQAPVLPPRRPSLLQRRPAHGPRPEQGPEGLHQPQLCHAGLLHPLYPRLGQPRHAH